jgi:PAS domain S-box-containing protein
MDGELNYDQLNQRKHEMALELMAMQNSVKALQDMLLEYRQIVENANSAIIKLSLQGVIEYINPFAEEILGIKFSELDGKNVESMISSDAHQTLVNAHKMFRILLDWKFNNIQSEAFVTQSLNKKIWISWTNKLLSDEQGRAISVILTGTDITRRKYAEDAFRESEFNLTKAQEIAGMGSWAWEIDTDNIHGSAYFFKIFGIHPVTSYKQLKQELSAIIHPEYSDFINKKIRRAILKGATESYLYQISHPDGQNRWILEEVSVLGDVDHKKQVLIGTIRDITNQKKTEDKLREYLLIVSSSSELMSLIDVDYRYINVNQSYLY